MGVIPRLLNRGNGDATSKKVPQHAINMIKWATEGWEPPYLRKCVDGSYVPPQYIEYTIKYIGQHPGMLTQQKPQFLAACEIARPDLYPILLTPPGDAWLDKVGDELGRALVTGGLKFLGIFG